MAADSESFGGEYFPELDRYYDQSESTALGIIRWGLAPSGIAGLEYGEFVQRGVQKRRRASQERRLQTIWKMAVDSVGCEAGPAVEFEARADGGGAEAGPGEGSEIEEKIEEMCSQIPGYEYLLTIPGFGPDISAKVLGALAIRFVFGTEGRC